MKFLYLSISIFLTINLFSQNLVPNPSFEVYDECPVDMTDYPQKDLIPDWFMPNKGTSDYFNACTVIQVGVPRNFIGNIWAFNGKAYAGIVLLEIHPSDTAGNKLLHYREYLQAELKEPLIKGQYYEVKLFYAIATYSTYCVNGLGIYLSEDKIKNRKNYRVLNYKPQLFAENIPIIKERDIWHELSDTIKSNGDEQYITIGNFFDDKHTAHERLDINEFNIPLQDNIKKNGIAYYYIDMVSVTLVND